MTIEEFKKKVAPYMKKGFVAMDKDGLYCYYKYKPVLDVRVWISTNGDYEELSCLNIEPVEDWTQSLIEVGK